MQKRYMKGDIQNASRQTNMQEDKETWSQRLDETTVNWQAGNEKEMRSNMHSSIPACLFA
jgi:hypothetical protein